MKQKNKIIANVSAVSFLALAALGQESFIQPNGQTNYIHQRLAQASPERLSGTAKASNLIGMTVNNYQGEKLGKVSDLAVDVESGRIVQVIISTGGFLGMGNTLTAVPPDALHQDAALKVLQLNIGKEKFKAAPKFDAAKWDEGTQSNRVSEVYGYYGEHPYFVAGQNRYFTTNQDGTFAGTLSSNIDGTINTGEGRAMDTAQNAEFAKTWKGTNFETETAPRNPDGTRIHDYSSHVNGSKSAWANLGYVQKASALMGTSVKNQLGENLGKVENFTVELSAGRIVAIIISSGGFLGMGDELSIVPPTALRFSADHDTLQLDASKESLASSPHFKANEWPDLNQPDYVGGVYRAYNVEPYFTTDATNSVDNTRLNVRDRDSRALTPLDQGNSQADVDTTAQIRKEIIADSGMTTNAKNVKIITLNGRVTLRGPVNTAEEKNRIAEIADRIASAGNVDNQLEVPTTPSSN